MNNISKRTLTFAILVLLSTVSSLAQLKVSLSITSHPDPYLSNWSKAKSTVIVTVINPGAKTIDAKFDCKVNLDGVLKANTKPESMRILNLPLGVSQFYGEDLVPFEAVKVADGADKTAITTGMLPAGYYEFCVSLLDPNTNALITQPVCKNFTMTSFQAPVLLQPQDGSTLAKLNRPTFRWTPVSPKYPSVVSYRVCVFEVLAGQTTMTAFRVNMPILDITTSSTSLIWPPDIDLPVFWAPANTNAGISIDEKGKGNQYVWSVQAQDDAGNPIIQDPTSWAEPYVFKTCGVDDSSADGPQNTITDNSNNTKDSLGNRRIEISHGHYLIKLLIPSDNSEVDLSKPQTFKWTALPKADNYSIKIVEIIGDQTPEMALKQNKPIYENLSISTNSIDIDSIHSQYDMQAARGIAWQVNSGDVESEPFTFVGCCWGDGDVDKVVNKLNDSVSLSSNLMRIILISPTTENPSQSLTPDFIWEIRTPNRKIGIMTYEIKLGVMTNDIDTNRSNGNVVVVWPINSEVIFEQKGIKENQLNFPSNLLPLDSTKAYCWQVTAFNQNGEKIGSSGLVGFPGLPSSDLTVAMVPCHGTSVTLNFAVCSGQFSNFPPIPFNFTGDCTGPISFDYGLQTFDNTVGTHNYSCTIRKGTDSYLQPVTINVLPNHPPSTQRVVSNFPTFTQCCEPIPNFTLVEANGSNLASNVFPIGTTFTWFISTTLVTSSVVNGYNFQNSCWDPQQTPILTPQPNILYQLGAITVKVTSANFTQIGPNFNNQISRLAGAPGGTTYYVRCQITYPPSCPGTFTTVPVAITVNPPNLPMIDATITATRPTCGNNGAITVSNVTNVTPYSLQLLGVTLTHLPPPLIIPNLLAGGLTTWNNLLETNSGYNVIILSTNNPRCGRVKTGDFKCNNCPTVPVVQSTPQLNNHNLPCPPANTPKLYLNTTIVYSASNPNIPYDPPYTYEWLRSPSCGLCNAGANCQLLFPTPTSGAQTPISTYVSIASIPTQTTNGALPNPVLITTPGCYILKVTDNTGRCHYSNRWFVETLPEKPIIAGPNTICVGGSALLSTSGDGLQWYRNGVLIPSATALTYQASTAGSYTVKSTVNDCTSESTPVNVTIGNSAAPIITQIGDICNGNVALSTAAPGQLTWSNGSHSPSITVSSSGTYSVYSVFNGCTSQTGSITLSTIGCPCPPNGLPAINSGPMTYSSPGVYQFTVGSYFSQSSGRKTNVVGCPGITFDLVMEVWGAGGSGGIAEMGGGSPYAPSGRPGRGGSGGGGGGYARRTLAITIPSSGIITYQVKVGNGGFISVLNGENSEIRNNNSLGALQLQAMGGSGGYEVIAGGWSFSFPGQGGLFTTGQGIIGTYGSWGASAQPGLICTGGDGGLGGLGGGVINSGGNGGHGGAINSFPNCQAYGFNFMYTIPTAGGNGRVKFSW